jgi:hypothetical protein
VVNTIASNGFNEGYVDGSCWFSFGSGHYPAVASGSSEWKSSTIHTQIQLFSSLGRQGFTNQYAGWIGTGDDPSLLNIAHVIDALGPVLIEGYRRHRPNYPGDLTEGWTAEASSPASGSNSYTSPANFEVFEAILFSTANGVSSTGNATKQRFGFGILGPDYQGCVVFGSDGSFFQSDSKAVANCTASGASVGVGSLNGSSFSLTNDMGGAADMIYHAFGRPPETAYWIPHFYRILNISGRNRPFATPKITTSPASYAVTGTAATLYGFFGYITLEDGTSKLTLEEGGGSLLL